MTRDSGGSARKRMLEALGARYKQHRLNLGVSQAEVAERLQREGVAGAHQMLVSRIESGQRDLTLFEADALARALDVPLSTLVAEQAQPVEASHLTQLTQTLMDARRDLTDRAWRSFEFARDTQLDHLKTLASSSSGIRLVDDSLLDWAARVAYMASQIRSIYDDEGMRASPKEATVQELIEAAEENLRG